MTLKIINLLFILCGFQLKAQINWSLIKHYHKYHLEENFNLYYKLKVDSLSNEKDKQLLKIYSHLIHHNDSALLSAYNNVNDTLDAFLQFEVGKKLLDGNKLEKEKWYQQNKDSGSNKVLMSVHRLIENPFDQSYENQMPNALQAEFKDYRKYYHKKPLVAGLLSAAVPGLGKLYGGRRHQFFQTLIVNTLYGLQTYELIKKLGPKNGFTITSISVFSVFYFGQIYGSIRDTRIVKKEKRKQLIYNAKNYFDYHF
jgi:TM2 domain-containing membrane protein YozV